MTTELIPVGFGPYDSADITGPFALFIKPASGDVPTGSAVFLLQKKNSGGNYNTIARLNAANVRIKGKVRDTGTFRVEQQPFGISAGMDWDVLTGGSITRSVPSGLPTLPMTLVSASPGTATASPNDAISAAIAYNAAIYNTGAYYVKPSTGSDAAAGTIGAPFATVAKAVRTATGAASTVKFLEDCTVGSFDLRNTDASQTTQQLKIIDANGFSVTIRDVMADLTTLTYTADATYTNCYTTSPGLAGAGQVTRVLRTDVTDTCVIDGVDVIAGLNVAGPIKKYTSAALLNAGSGDGWFWDNTGKVLWIKLGAGTNVESQKSILKGMFSNAAATSRIYAQGSAIAFKGIRFEGVQFASYDGGGRRSDIWLHNCVQLWAIAKGWDGTNSGYFVNSDCTIYASTADNMNAFAPSATGRGLVVSLRCNSHRAGDTRVFAVDGTVQGASIHGGSDHVSWGSSYFYNNGQGIADTCINSSNDVSWIVTPKAGGQTGGVTVANYSVGSAATSASRKMYIDSGVSETNAGGDAVIAPNGTLYTYNTTLAVVTGGTAIPYTPASPP